MTFIVLLQNQTLYVLVKGRKNKPTTNLQTFIKYLWKHIYTRTYHTHRHASAYHPFHTPIHHTYQTHTTYPSFIPHASHTTCLHPHISHTQHPLCTHATPTSYSHTSSHTHTTTRDMHITYTTCTLTIPTSHTRSPRWSWIYGPASASPAVSLQKCMTVFSTLKALNSGN